MPTPPSSPRSQVGSGFDVSAAVFGTHTYTRFSPSELADALSAGEAPTPTPDSLQASVDTPATSSPLDKISRCVDARGGWDARRGVLRLPSCFRLLMGDVCGGSSTPSMVRKVRHGGKPGVLTYCAATCLFVWIARAWHGLASLLGSCLDARSTLRKLAAGRRKLSYGFCSHRNSCLLIRPWSVLRSVL